MANTEHKTKILDLSQGRNTIYQATCSCGEWESPNLHTRRSGAVYDARTHRNSTKD